MALIGFETPPSVGDMIGMLNETGQFRLSLVSLDGTVLGHLNTKFAKTHISQTGQALLIDGDTDEDAHPLFAGETDELAATFVYGVFFGKFGGRRLEDIQEELTRRPERFI